MRRKTKEAFNLPDFSIFCWPSPSRSWPARIGMRAGLRDKTPWVQRIPRRAAAVKRVCPKACPRPLCARLDQRFEHELNDVAGQRGRRGEAGRINADEMNYVRISWIAGDDEIFRTVLAGRRQLGAHAAESRPQVFGPKLRQQLVD